MRKEARLGPLRVNAPTGHRTRDLQVDQSDALPLMPPRHGLRKSFIGLHILTHMAKLAEINLI